MAYKLLKNLYTDEAEGVLLTKDDGTVLSIPFDEANTDYQEYLEWLSEGNTPEEAE